MRERMRALAGLASMLLCACEEPPPPSRPPPLPDPAPIATPRALGSSGAFDLVATPEGALLVWGGPRAQGGGVRALALTPLGVPVGAEHDVASGGHGAARAADDPPATQVVELVAVSSGAVLGVAWIAPTVAGHVAEAIVSRGGVEGFGPPFELSAAAVVVAPGSVRGRLAGLVGEDGALRVRLRTPPRRCDGASAPCEGTRRFRLDDVAARGVAEGPDESVPVACEPFVVGGVASLGSYFHGLCTLRDGVPSTVVYALDPEPMHAAALMPLDGCEPLGLAPTDTGAALAARCPEGVSLAWIGATGALEGTARPAHLEASCAGGRPTLVALAPDGARLDVALTGARSRLEALLDDAIAGPNARAIWTGTALLVATPDHGEVRLGRWECPPGPGPLRRTDHR